MAKKRNSAFLSRLAMGIIFLIAVIYAVYHLVSLFTGDDLKTIAAGVTTHSVKVGGSGYVFRDEVLLTSENRGAIEYLTQNGGRVSEEQTIANVYEGNDQTVREVILSLDRQIALLEQSTGGVQPLDLGTLRKEANDTYYKLSGLLAGNKAGELNSQIKAMMITLNRISAMTDGEEKVLGTLAELKKQRADIFQGEYETAYAPYSGYFYYSPDGYEKDFNSQAIEELTEDSFYGLLDKLDSSEPKLSDNVIGKIAKNSFWYLVLPLSEKDAQMLSVGQECILTFPENNATKLPMTLQKTVDAKDQDQVLCVFYCNRLPNDFKLERCQNVEVELLSSTGIYVPRSAMTRVDGVRGVYVLRGSVVHFRCVDVVYDGADFCLVKEDAEPVGEYFSLGTNELIITEGKNLFDGRILE